MDRMKQSIVYQKVGKSGAEYQIEIQVFWDDRINGDLRVIGSIDDGKLRAFFPLTLDFIKRVPQKRKS
jgi:hypothetical protein